MSRCLVFSVILTFALSVSALAGKGDQNTNARKDCQAECRAEHKALVKACIDSHDPRTVTPSARGQCIEAYAKALQNCMEGCKSLPR
jgi:hypothetical protein